MQVYNKLPADIRKVFDDNIDYWGIENDKFFEGAHKAGYEFGVQQKVEFIKLPKEEMAKFYAAFTNTANKLAKDLDAKGHPGTKIYQEAQALVKKYNK